MHQLVCGILLPTLLAAYTERSSRCAWQHARAPQQAEQQQQAQQAGRDAQRAAGEGPAGTTAWCTAAGCAAGKVWGRMDAGLQELCLATDCCVLQRATAVWVLLGHLWVLARAAAA